MSEIRTLDQMCLDLALAVEAGDGTAARAAVSDGIAAYPDAALPNGHTWATITAQLDDKFPLPVPVSASPIFAPVSAPPAPVSAPPALAVPVQVSAQPAPPAQPALPALPIPAGGDAINGPAHGTLRIVHNVTDGTILYGTEKHDGTRLIIGSDGQRWSYHRVNKHWFLSHSNAYAADQRRIAAAAWALRCAGWNVQVEIDDTRNGQSVPAKERNRAALARIQEVEHKARRQGYLSAADIAAAVEASTAPVSAPPAVPAPVSAPPVSAPIAAPCLHVNPCETTEEHVSRPAVPAPVSAPPAPVQVAPVPAPVDTSVVDVTTLDSVSLMARALTGDVYALAEAVRRINGTPIPAPAPVAVPVPVPAPVQVSAPVPAQNGHVVESDGRVSWTVYVQQGATVAAVASEMRSHLNATVKNNRAVTGGEPVRVQVYALKADRSLKILVGVPMSDDTYRAPRAESLYRSVPVQALLLDGVAASPVSPVAVPVA